MWSKSIRTVLVILIYNEIFLLDYPQLIEKQISAIAREYKLELSEQDTASINIYFDRYQNNKIELESIISSFITSWNKTFDLIKAMLFAAVIELQLSLNTDGQFEDPELLKTIVSKYIHLSQDIVGGNNPGLIHAVLLAFIESKSVSISNTIEKSEDES